MPKPFNTTVSVMVIHNHSYPALPPFNPSEAFSEYCLGEVEQKNYNHIYASIRELFYYSKLDMTNYGTTKWNPLGFAVKPGNLVVIKPNLIAESVTYDPTIWEHVITHGSLIRAIIDYVYIALKGDGRIVICDSPQNDTNIELLKQKIGLHDIQSLYLRKKKFNIEFYDLRKEYVIKRNGVLTTRKKLQGDPHGYVNFNIGNASELAIFDVDRHQYYGSDYNIDETNSRHNNGNHEYSFSQLALDADVFINLPKLKTHKKVGATLNIKNLVGLTGDKNWLPHYRFGAPPIGDQFPLLSSKRRLENLVVTSLKKIMYKKFKFIQGIIGKLIPFGYQFFGKTSTVIRSGNWYGNDTTWRMCLDLLRIFLYGNKKGELDTTMNKRKYLSFVDGVVAMEGEGPLSGKSKDCGLLIFGTDMLNVDLVCTKIMGFDYQKINLLKTTLQESIYSVSKCKYKEILVVSNISKFNKPLKDIQRNDTYSFSPHFGWKNHIELK